MWSSENKNHRDYIQDPCRQVAGFNLRVPPSTGFVRLEGSAFYYHQEHNLKVVICSRKVEKNHGPGFMESELIPWNLARNDAMKLLREKMQDLKNRMVNGEVPKKGMFLETCNRSNRELGEFLEQRCSSCRCSYCELFGK